MIKSILVAVFFSTLILSANAQLIPMTYGYKLKLNHPPLELIGEVDGKSLYSQAFDFIQSNQLDLYTVENKEFLKKERIQIPEDYILQVFIYKEGYFLFTSHFKTGEYSIVQLNDNLEEVNRIKLLDKKEDFSVKDISVQDNIPRYFRYFQQDNKIGISIKRTQNRFVVVDLENMTFASHISDLKKDEEYTIEDCLFGDGLDAIFALGTANDNEALVICKEQNHRNVIIPFTNKKTGDYRRSFKFAKNNETNYLTSFYINESKKEQGYTLTPIPNFDFSTLELICFPDQTLNNPAIWTEGQYKKVQNGDLPIENYNLKLVSAEFSNGFLILKSQDWHELGCNNIMISRIDLEADIPKVTWTFLSHFVMDSYYNYFTKLGNQSFISFIKDDQMQVLYNVQLNHITPSGVPNLKDREVLGESSFQRLDARIVKANINLTTGEFTSKTAEPFEGSIFKGKLTSPSYHIEDGELTYLLYKTDYATKQFSAPIIVSIPLD